ncbi:uncharacterized protein DUF3311 [Blastomonas natatoria]|uniref:Uncharacterized protein DUF3311 n=2 Tax=Blastomonas natatoria TaxID=34015 RepID=A0A2V3V2I9_9SPHN|nr:uncharacterized protein DUF3311 [Blastomonas natatoria]
MDDMSAPPHHPALARRWHLALLLLPFLWQVGAVPLVNDIAWRPFGLPFPIVWQMAGVLFASAVIALVRAIDLKREQRR